MSVDPFNYVGGIWILEVLALFGGCCMGGDNFVISTINLNYFTSPIWGTKY
jgi:hypothetical protein